MAAFTIATDTYFDTLVGRVGGDTFTVSAGKTLTIRSDSRVGPNAPSGMVGSIGGLTGSAAGSKILMDGTAVRWMAIDSGAGTVPAAGTVITQGGVSGYLLGVWADYASAPVVSGAAMPVTGYLKFREVTGGPFAVGALTGITANASSPDVTGWIEIVHDSNSSIVGSETSAGFFVQGDWFYLDNTTGVPGQQINTPANGGGVGTHVFGIQIETAPGSNVFEWYVTASATVGSALWKAANITTDIRAKIVETMGNGVIRIGSDGTTNIGYTPPAGCKVRMPNVIGRTVATASRNVNMMPSLTANIRYNITFGNHVLDKYHSDGRIGGIGNTVLYVSNVSNTAFDWPMTFLPNKTPIVWDNVVFTVLTNATLVCAAASNLNGGTFSNCKFAAAAPVMTFSSSSNLTVNDCEFISVKAKTSAPTGIGISGSHYLTFNRTKMKANVATLANSDNITFNDTDYIDRLEGPTTSSGAASIFTLTSSSYITINGITYGEKGVLANTQNTANMVNTTGTTINNNLKIRNIGTRLSPLNCGTNSALYPTVWSASGGEFNVKVQRVYVSGSSAYPVVGTSGLSESNILLEDVYSSAQTNLSGLSVGGRNFYGKRVVSASSVPSPTIAQGIHWIDQVNTTTIGKIFWYGSIPTPETANYNTLVGATSYYQFANSTLTLSAIGDYFISESQWMFLGHTSISGTVTGIQAGAPLLYDLDTGAGFSGIYKAVTGIGSEVIPASGFKLRIKAIKTTSSVSVFSTLTFTTVTSAVDQAANQYPLDTNTLAFTGLASGSEVRCYVGTDPASAVEVGGVESTAGSTFSFSHSVGGQDGYIVILAMGYQPVRIPYTYKSVDDSILIQPVIDRNYVA